MYNKKNTKLTELKDGSHLLTINIPSYPVSLVAIRVRAGAKYEETGKEGVAHFLEHLFLDASEKYPIEKERLKIIAGLGANQNAYTQPDYVVYHNTVIPENIVNSLETLAECFYNSRFEQSDFEKERKIILDEEERAKSTTQSLIYNMRTSGLWPNNRLGVSTLGTRESIQEIQKDDVSEFKNKFYASKNVLFLVIGDIETSEAVNTIEKFQKEKMGQPEKGLGETIATQLAPVKYLSEIYGMDQVQLSIAFRIDGITTCNKEAIALSFLKDALFNGQVSIFGQRLRLDEGLTYGVGGISRFTSNTGYFGCQISSKADKILNMIAILKEEFKKFLDNGFSEEDLEMYKSLHLLNSAKNMLNPGELLDFVLSQDIINGQMITRDEYTDIIKELTGQEILEVAKKYLIQENLSVTVLVNEKDKGYIDSSKDNITEGW